MPIKILNTFTKDWVIQARISSRTELIKTKNGGKLLKIELIDRNDSKIEGVFFNEAAI